MQNSEVRENCVRCSGTKVVNIRTYKGKYTYIGRGSIFGNPFRIGIDGDRTQVIEKYRALFYDRLKDVEFLRQVLDLKGKVLGCYCKPLPCHGDVIVEFLERYCRSHTIKGVNACR